MNKNLDVYFSADIETDGPIPGPFSMLSFALVYAGSFDGNRLIRPERYDRTFYRELKPISDEFEQEALAVNGLDRESLKITGSDPQAAINEAVDWIAEVAKGASPVLVAFPLSFDWSWLYWYFVKFARNGSPFGHSRCFDIKTALALRTGRTIANSGKSQLPIEMRSEYEHTHNALDDAREQAEIFAKVFQWREKQQ